MTINSMIAIARISAMGDKPFYAKDVCMSGGLASHLAQEGSIIPTGKTREYTLPHPWNEKMLIKCEVKEWTADKEEIQCLVENCINEIAKIEAQLKAYHEFVDTVV